MDEKIAALLGKIADRLDRIEATQEAIDAKLIELSQGHPKGQLLSTKDAAALLGVHYSTLSQWKSEGCFIELIHFFPKSAGVLWDGDALQEWQKYHNSPNEYAKRLERRRRKAG